jgi:hypothetical protein
MFRGLEVQLPAADRVDPLDLVLPLPVVELGLDRERDLVGQERRRVLDEGRGELEEVAHEAEGLEGVGRDLLERLARAVEVAHHVLALEAGLGELELDGQFLVAALRGRVPGRLRDGPVVPLLEQPGGLRGPAPLSVSLF